MRLLLLLIITGLVMLLVGWVTVTNYQDQTTITLETSKIKDDAQDLLDQGKAATEKAGQKARDLLEPAPQN